MRMPKPRRGPGGNAVWHIGPNENYYWNGPGARLKLMFGGQLISIDHPLASGHYDNLREAAVALRRYLGR